MSGVCHMSKRFTPIDVTIPEDRWEPVGYLGGPNEDRWIRLMGPSLCINGCFLHVMAYEVTEVDDVQQPAHPVLHEDFTYMQRIYEGAYETVTIRNRQYVLLLHPYGT
jgi:hypothetical protein